MTADGAYDSDAVYQAAIRRHDPSPDVVIPPRASAVASTDDLAAQTPRDCHIRLIAEQGRMAWELKQKHPQALYDEMATMCEKMRAKARQVRD